MRLSAIWVNDMTGEKEYAKALFLLLEEEAKTDAVLEDVTLVRDVMRSNPAYAKLLDTPALSAEQKLAMIDEAFAEVDHYVKNVLKLLCEKHSVHRFPAIADAFCACYDEARGNLRVEAITAIPMNKKQLQALQKKLEEKTGNHIFVKNTVDPAILGGMVLRYGGIQLDGSVKARLSGIEKSLKELVI